MNKTYVAVCAVAFCFGLAILGFYIDKGLQSFSNRERVVSVKGLAEQLVRASGAQIVVATTFTGNDPNDIIARLDRRQADVIAYLNENKLTDFKVSDINITDLKTTFEYEWVNGNRITVPRDRYHFRKEITVQFDDVEKASSAGKTVELGLLQKNMPSEVRVDYTFPELNLFKAELLSDSIKNARVSGEQFAKDSDSKLGKIKTASQGQISIVGRDYYDYSAQADVPKEPYMQKARVVSNIVFYLED